MTQNRVINTSVGYTVNQSSVAAVQAANSQVAASFASAQAAAATMSASVLALNPGLAALASQGQVINANVVAPMQAASAATQNLIRDIGDLGKDIQSIPEPPMSAFGLAEDPTGGGGGSGLGGLRSGFRAGGMLLGSAAGGQDLRAVGSIVTLTSVLGPLGIVAGVGALALRSVADAEQKATEEAKAYETALTGIATSTTTDIQKQIDQLNLQKQAYQSAETGLQSIYDQAKKLADGASKFPWQEGYINAEQYSAGLDNLDKQVSVATGGMITSAGGLSTALDNGQVTIDKTTGQIGFLTLALNSNATAANTAAQAELDRGKQQVSDADRAVAISNMTADARKTQADAENNEVVVIGEYINAHHLSAAAVTELTNKQYDLIADVQMLTDVTHSYADSLADVQQRADAVKNMFDAITKEGEAMQKVAADQQAIAGAASDHADKLREIATTEQDKELQDRQKAAQQLEDDTAKHLQKLADISNQAASDHEADVGNRDALANYKDAQKADQAAQKENAAFTLQEQQQQAHLADTLAADAAAEQKQLASENSSYAKRNAQLVVSLNNDQVLESRAAGLELAYQRQANDAQLTARIQANAVVATVDQSAHAVRLNAEIAHQNAMSSAAYYGAATIETAFIQLMQRVVQIVGGALSSGGGFGLHNTGGNSLSGGNNSGLPSYYESAGAFSPFPTTSVIQQIVNAQINNMIREANR